MKLWKAKKDDHIVLQNDKETHSVRACALSRLASDQRRELEPYIADLVSHKVPILRAEAIRVLVGRWNLKKYLSACYNLLFNDPDVMVREYAACALAGYARYQEVISENEKKRVLRALAKVVQSDIYGANEAAYDGILQILGYPIYELLNLNRMFDPKIDVNWDLLKPFLDNNETSG